MQALRDALQNEQSTVTLDVAALELAQVEFPGMEIEPSLSRLDNMAEEVRLLVPTRANGLNFIGAVNEILFDVMQFRGNEDEYFDPRNSCLNSVLMRRLGIPISLSIIYMELARRLDRAVYGIGLPGHFIVAYQDSESRYWIDPFHRGSILSFEDCFVLAKETGGVDLRANPAVLAPVSNRQILVRMLSNLKTIYLRGQALDKAKVILDLLIEAMPDYPEEYRHRGLIHLRRLNHRAATADLEKYLQLETNSPDRAEVEKQLVLIQRWKAGLN